MAKHIADRDKAVKEMDKYLARVEVDIERLQAKYPLLKNHGHLAVIQRHVYRYLEGRRSDA